MEKWKYEENKQTEDRALFPCLAPMPPFNPGFPIFELDLDARLDDITLGPSKDSKKIKEKYDEHWLKSIHVQTHINSVYIHIANIWCRHAVNKHMHLIVPCTRPEGPFNYKVQCWPTYLSLTLIFLNDQKKRMINGRSTIGSWYR